MNSFVEFAYQRSPVLLQNIFISSYGFLWKKRRMGGNYKNYLKDFKERENFGNEDWNNFCREELKKILLYSFKYVPYYISMFKNLGIEEVDLKNFELKDLKKLPLLEKKVVAEKLDRFVPSNVKKLQYYETSGTTGTPLKIYYSSEDHKRVFAAMVARFHNWAKVNPTDKHITFGGRTIFKTKDPKNRFWRYNIFENQLYMSAFHLSPETVKYYVEKINSFNPVFINGYTSAIYYVAKQILEKGLKTRKIPVILTSSDKLTRQMREIINKAWSAKIFDGYSSVEGCCLITECEYGKYHISPDAGIIEILDEERRDAEEGEIVATGLLNYSFPLIRYKMGDMAIRSKEQKCPCGRNMPIIKEILGREEDYLILKDKRASASFSKAFEGVKGIIEGQVIQLDYDYIKVFLVKSEKYTEEEKNKFLKNIFELFGKLKVELIYVDKIERTKRGKLKLVISNLKERIKDE